MDKYLEYPLGNIWKTSDYATAEYLLTCSQNISENRISFKIIEMDMDGNITDR